MAHISIYVQYAFIKTLKISEGNFFLLLMGPTGTRHSPLPPLFDPFLLFPPLSSSSRFLTCTSSSSLQSLPSSSTTFFLSASSSFLSFTSSSSLPTFRSSSPHFLPPLFFPSPPLSSPLFLKWQPFLPFASRSSSVPFVLPLFHIFFLSSVSSSTR